VELRKRAKGLSAGGKSMKVVDSTLMIGILRGESAARRESAGAG